MLQPAYKKLHVYDQIFTCIALRWLHWLVDGLAVTRLVIASAARTAFTGKSEVSLNDTE